MNFSIEESKENDLIMKAATGNIKTWTIRNLVFSLTLQAVRINNQGAPLVGLAKSIYYKVVFNLIFVVIMRHVMNKPVDRTRVAKLLLILSFAISDKDFKVFARVFFGYILSLFQVTTEKQYFQPSIK